MLRACSVLRSMLERGSEPRSRPSSMYWSSSVFSACTLVSFGEWTKLARRLLPSYGSYPRRIAIIHGTLIQQSYTAEGVTI